MKNVEDRLVEFPNRYKLTNVETNEVLGIFDFEESPGDIENAGTEINAELFDSISTDLSNCYSEANPPSYPVISVNGQTGAVTTNDIPAGGTTGQVLAKASETDFDTEWKTLDQGIEVEANPTDTATNELEKLKVGTITYSIPSGTEVTANPTDEATVELEKLKVGTVTYSIPSGGAQILTATVKTSTEWGSQNPVLAAGELGYDTTNKITKIGDGSTHWKDLDIFVTKSQPTFANSDWATIAELSENGQAQSVFNVGDEKTIELTTGEEITLVILGFNHDDLTSGGKAGITIGMKELLATKYRMNSSDTNVGGWDESEMRTSTMPTLLSQLPADLQSVIKQVKKKATAGGTSQSITTSTDKLFLLAVSEIYSATSIKNSDSGMISNYADTYNAQGTQYEYYRNLIGDNNGGTRTNANLIKKLSNGGGSASAWWLRSPSVVPEYGTSTHFRRISGAGDISGDFANNTCGVSFGFCV